MLDELLDLQETGLRELEGVAGLGELEAWRVKYVGSKGRLTQRMRGIGQLPAEQRPEAGKVGNQVKKALETAHAETVERLKAAERARALEAERIDVTLPGRPVDVGRLHLATQTLRQIYDIFADMGFQVYRSRDVETDAYNFELLNIPKHHPARDMQDTFYIDGERLLRTHTSPGQIRAMREYYPEPIRVICQGCATATSRSQPARRSCSIRWRAWLWAGTSPWAISRGRWSTSRAACSGRTPRCASAHPISPHRTQRRDGHRVHHLRRGRLLGVQTRRLAGDSGVGHGPSAGAVQRRL